MADIDWPVGLPTAYQQSGYTEGDVDNLITSTMMSGPIKRRPRTTLGYLPINVEMILSSTEKSTFEDFYNITIKYGALPFNFPDYTGTSTTEVFLDSKQITPMSGSGKHWKLAMALRTLV